MSVTPLAPPPRGVQRWIPSLRWWGRYDGATARGDLVAGVTTAVMLIPQGMAYAMLAGLPPIIGLYASLVPLAIYAMLGTSRQLAVGPVAMVSLLVAQGVAPLAGEDPARYLTLAVLLALMIGVIQLVLGLLRLGFLVNFLSHPVVSGFTSAAALVIGISQLGPVLGVSIPRGDPFAAIAAAFEAAERWHWPTIIIAVATVGALVALKRWAPRWPRALIVVVLGTAAVALGVEGVAIVGAVPAGLPGFSVPAVDLASLRGLWPIAVTIALVSFMESISVAKAFARKNRYAVDPNQELVALGAANLGGAFFSAYPVTGGFSRTAVNAQAGARTPLAGLLTAALIGVTLLWLTPLFHDLPKAVLAGIIVTAVAGLVDVAEVRHLWRVKRVDLVALVLTFAATLTLGFEVGILVGVGVSLALFVHQTTRPHFAVLGRLPDRPEVFRNIKRYPEAVQAPGVLIVRIDAQLYFGNVSFLKETLETLEREASAPIHAVVLDAAGVNQLDSSAAQALVSLERAYAERGITLIIAQPKGPVRDVMDRAHLSSRLGPARMPLSLDEALQVATR